MYRCYVSVNYAEVEKCAQSMHQLLDLPPLLRTWTRMKGVDESASVVVDNVMVSLMNEVRTGVRTGGMLQCWDQGYRRHA